MYIHFEKACRFINKRADYAQTYLIKFLVLLQCFFKTLLYL